MDNSRAKWKTVPASENGTKHVYHVAAAQEGDQLTGKPGEAYLANIGWIDEADAKQTAKEQLEEFETAEEACKQLVDIMRNYPTQPLNQATDGAS